MGDGKVYYISSGNGTYTNFDDIVIDDDRVYMLYRINGGWAKQLFIPDMSEAIRKSVTPSSYTSYLPEATPFTTPLIIANTPTKILIPTTIKTAKDFAIEEVTPGNLAVVYKGDATRTFKVFLSSSVTASASNIVLGLYMYRNGIVEPGIGNDRKLSGGGDLGALGSVGEFTADPGDRIEVYLKVSVDSTVTFSRTSIIITEKN